MNQEQYEKMRWLAAQIRIKTIRCLESAGSGHIGGCMSIADVLGVLYGGVMCFDPENPHWEGRDRLILSKGHSGPALYAALCLSGFFPEEKLYTLNQGGTSLPSHCDRMKTPGIDMTTGSLGQGLSCACGIATALRFKKSDSHVYAILGDGELQEGQVWEAVQYAAHRKLFNLTVFIDNNKKQLDGKLTDICEPFDLEEKFRAFGFYSTTVKGYDVKSIYEEIETASEQKEKPQAIILDTYKGLGCNFAEQTYLNHYMAVSKEMADGAVLEIERRYKAGGVIEEDTLDWT